MSIGEGTVDPAWFQDLDRASGLDLSSDLEGWSAHPADTVPERRLDDLDVVSRLLGDAREASARLNTTRALRLLHRAQLRVASAADLPGAASWAAEVEVALALLAIQAGRARLAEQAFRRAAHLDPSRRVRAAEARPSVVRLANRIHREAALAPIGHFEIEADVPGARVVIDGRDHGIAPLLVRLPVGRHLVQVRAPGHCAFGRLVDVFEGARPRFSVAFSPTRRTILGRAIARAARQRDFVRLAELSTEAAVPIFAVAAENRRALLVRCASGVCTTPERFSTAPELLPIAPSAVFSRSRWRAALAWLGDTETDDGRPSPAWWERWYVWAGASFVVAATVFAVWFVTEPDSQARFEVMIDPPLPSH